ncbi:alpha/beta fold hydrolase [Streptomyces sp.]|uniref:alpha/beta fold hydrolase n=1 Tax=Streptomyces sp. TaxID=1931 RepID=UPI002F41DBBF
MSKVISKDGTPIAYDRWGSGPALVLVDGAMGHRAFGSMPALAKLLADEFTVYAYDRRGRGESGDTAPYAVAREVEDLGALIEEAGGSAYVYGISSGGALTLEAAAGGLPIARMALYEPPYTAARFGPERKKEYTERLESLITAGRNGDAVAYFLNFVGNPPEAVDGMRHSPVWPMFEAVAPTLAYDNAVLGEAVVPVALAARVTVPALVVDGGASPDAMRSACGAIAEALPAARYRTLAGETHQVSPTALAPVLREFFR